MSGKERRYLPMELQLPGLGLLCSRTAPPVRPGSPGGLKPGTSALTPRAPSRPVSSGSEVPPYPPTCGLGPPCQLAEPSGSGTQQEVGSSWWETCPLWPASLASLMTWQLELRWDRRGTGWAGGSSRGGDGPSHWASGWAEGWGRRQRSPSLCTG